MNNYLVTMERKGSKTNYLIKDVKTQREAIDKAYEQAVEYSHVIACRKYKIAK